MALFLGFVSLLAAAASDGCVLDDIQQAALVHPSVRSKMCELGFVKTSVLVRLKVKADLNALDDDDLAALGSRALRRWTVYNFLSDHAKKTQRNVRTALGDDVKAESFWIVNAIHVPAITLPAMKRLLRLAAADIEIIEPVGNIQRVSPILRPKERVTRSAVSSSKEDVQWNIKLIGAEACWQNNITGSGIVVATLDGGVNRSVLEIFFFLQIKTGIFSC